MHELYLKKFSLGISLQISLEEYQLLLDKYLPYLSSVYFSLPYGDEFHTRMKVIEEYKEKNAVSKLLKILKLFKENGIKLEAVINQYHIETGKALDALKDFSKFIEIDTVCCLDEYINVIKEYYNDIYMIRSINNNIIHQKDINNISKQYNMVVLGREFLRNTNLIKTVRKRGFEIKLLLNNGCSFNCYSCRAGNEMCRKVFEDELAYNSPQELYAKQSFFPWELNKLYEKMKENNDLDIIDELKISNRPCTYEYLNKCLESYIFNEGEEKYLNESFKNYHLWGRQSNLTPYFKDFNLKAINEIKEIIWKKNEE